MAVQKGVRVAAVCMNSDHDTEKNIRKARQLVAQAISQGAQWVLLPEMFTYMGPYEGLNQAAVRNYHEFPKCLLELTRRHGVCLFGGSVPEKISPPRRHSSTGICKVYNTCFSFNEKAELISSYRKTHLFNLRNSEGQVLYGEADGFCPGDRLTTVQLHGWNIGFAVCYDIRFPEFSVKLSQNAPVDVLMVPAAFTRETGEDHWLLLLRARALELQCYVIAADQTGIHAGNRECFGHSVIIDPWGRILGDTGPGEGIVCLDLDPGVLSSVRDRLPVLQNTRRDLLPPVRG